MLLPSLEKMYIFHVGFADKQRIAQFKRHKETVATSFQRATLGTRQKPPTPLAHDEVEGPEQTTDLGAGKGDCMITENDDEVYNGQPGNHGLNTSNVEVKE